MGFNEVLTNILGLITGVGLFMVACDILSDNLQAISSNKLKALFSKVSDNKIIGVCIGAATTMLIQSSGATIVMLIGFVNTNIISLHQASYIILGSEIGTTLTAQIVALGTFNEDAISFSVVFATLVGIGAFINLVAKKAQSKSMGGVMIGLGMIFVGLSSMSASMDSFAKLDALKTFIALIKSPVLLILIGAILTALIQSSSAMTTIAITMIAAGLINLEQGIYITLGANVGSCITGVLAAIVSGTNAKRTSLYQLFFNIGGVVILAVIDAIVKTSTGGSISVSNLIANAFPNVPSTQLAMFHTIFNVASVVVALPISDYLMDLCEKLIVGKESDKKELKLYYFDENMMSTPSIAVQQVKNEIMNMAEIAINNFNISAEIITSLNFERNDEFVHNENQLDYLNTTLVDIVSRLSKKVSNNVDFAYMSATYRVVSDLERIGDYSENIIEYAEILRDTNQKFSPSAIKEINEVREMINELFGISMRVYDEFNEDLMKQAYDLEEKIDDLTEQMSKNHIERMNQGKCNAEIGAQYLQLSSDVERIGDHLININDNDHINVH